MSRIRNTASTFANVRFAGERAQSVMHFLQKKIKFLLPSWRSDENSRIRNQIRIRYLEIRIRRPDPRIRISSKMWLIRNTASTFAGQRAQVRYAFPGELREGQPPVRAGLQPLQGRPDWQSTQRVRAHRTEASSH